MSEEGQGARQVSQDMQGSAVAWPLGPVPGFWEAESGLW